jgi:biofilm PGA synthesis N-glycosyltransferase PgaC
MIYFAIICFAFLFYSYVGFPLLISLLATLRPRKWAIDETYRPTVSIILSAYNEERVLSRCLTSLVNLNYPVENLEILCGSDGSTDRTNEIIRNFQDPYPRIHAFLFPKRRGKMLTLNDLVARARHEILLFVDADITLSPNAILDYVRHYADPNVGGVAGRMVIAGDHSDGVYKSESIFLSFENNLRRNEAKMASTMGVNGANYTMRRSLWHSLPDTRVHDDFYSMLNVVLTGKRMLYEENAIATELYGRNFHDEFLRKLRGASRGFYTLSLLPRSLFTGPTLWMLWPHKLIRFTTGLLFIGGIIGSLFAYRPENTFVSMLLLMEGLLIITVLLGWIARLLHKTLPLCSEAYWFFSMNMAFLLGGLQFLFRKDKPTWAQTAQVTTSENILLPNQEVIHQ